MNAKSLCGLKIFATHKEMEHLYYRLTRMKLLDLCFIRVPSVAKFLIFTRCALFVYCCLTAVVSAAPPKVNNLYPAGCQRGNSITVTAAGDFSTWPVQVWVDRPGVSFTAEKDKGKFKVEVASDAAAGIYWLRMHNAEGASVPRPFVVGTLTEVAEAETNDLPDKSQVVESRVVVNGKLGKQNDVDSYRVELKRGQTLVASLAANSYLGSPMDAVLQVCELVERSFTKASGVREHPGDVESLPGKNNREANASRSPEKAEAFIVSQNHDAVGIDPQIVFTAERDGLYLVRLFAFPAVPDSTIRFAGGDDYIYRLTLTTGPFLDHVLPLAVPREESQVELGGWNLGRTATTIVPPVSADANPLTPPDEPLVWVWRADVAGAVLIQRVEMATQAANKTLVPPMTVSGRLAVVGQVDSYSFVGQKDKKLRFKVAAKSLGYPTDAVLIVTDEAGKPLAEADDASRDDRDPTLDFSPPADGKYRLLVRDLANRGDARMVYRLMAEPIEPDFSLALAADSFFIEKGKPLEIAVNVAVRDGLRESIEIRAVGLPPGVTADAVKFEPKDDAPQANSGSGRGSKRGGSSQASAPSVKLVLKSDGSATAGGFPVRIEGCTAGANAKVRTARFPLNLPLAGSHFAAWVTVK